MEEHINTLFKDIIQNNSTISAQKFTKIFEKNLQTSIKDGEIEIGVPDYSLGDKFLEWKVHDIFNSFGADFLAINEDKNTHDGIFNFNIDSESSKPLNFVLEIKHHKKGGAKRYDLRQLDDWVFTASGEEYARKGPVSAIQGRFSGGLPVTSSGDFKHPDPHKGLFIFNHDTERAPEERCKPFGPNEIDFAQHRNFCLIDFLTLLDLHHRFLIHEIDPMVLLKSMHETTGQFNINNLPTSSFTLLG